MAVEKIIVGRTRADFEQYGDKGAVFIGKNIVGEGEESHLANPVHMDVIRPHIVLISGKRGSGKCVEENTLILMGDGSVVPIRELENNQQLIFGLNNKLKISKMEKSSFFKRKVDKLLHIRLRSGREIKLTPEHPLLTIKGWSPVNELKIGSRIATPRIIDSFGNVVMDENNIKILAYLLAEGHIKNSLARFTNSDDIIVSDFIKSVEGFDSNLRIVQHRRGSYGVSQIKKKVDLSGILKDENNRNFAKGNKIIAVENSIVLWLRKVDVYDRLSVDKYIPKEVFLLPKEQLSLFLNRLFSCDGSIYKHKATQGVVWEVSYSSSSKILIQQVQHLLLRFGIVSKLRSRKVKFNERVFDSYEIIIGAENVETFIKEIGFFGRKNEKVAECLSAISVLNRNPNVDTIPKEIWDIYRPQNWAKIGREMGYSIAKGLRSSINYGPSRQKLLQISDIDGNEKIRIIAESDIFWDEIVFMEELEGEFNVCDITVPEMHNFVANDILVHNSYTGAVIGEGITLLPEEIRQNISVLMIDTMGIFWSMKRPNERDAALLEQWVMKPSAVETKLFVPKGYVEGYGRVGVVVDSPFTLSVSELSDMDWIITFGFDMMSSHALCITRTIKRVKNKYSSDYSIDDVIKQIEMDEKTEQIVKDALINRFLAAKEWGIFERRGTPILELFQPGVVSVLDISHYARGVAGWSVRALLLGILSRKIFQHRLEARKEEEFESMGGSGKKAIPMVWIVIDEAHQFIPADQQTVASEPLLALIKEGREPGISMVLITQMPNKLHPDALAQCDLVISHRLTAKSDVLALRSVMQTYVLKDLQGILNSLPRDVGCAVVLDDNSERLYAVQIRPRLSWHAGGSPTAIPKRALFE